MQRYSGTYNTSDCGMRGKKMGMKSVYVMKSSDGSVKIGVSKNVEKRKKTLESTFGITMLEMYNTELCSNSYEIESLMHDMFSDFKIHGEWFCVDYRKAVLSLRDLFKKAEILEEESKNDGMVDYIKQILGDCISEREKYILLLEKRVEMLEGIVDDEESLIEKLFSIAEHLNECIYGDLIKPDEDEIGTIMPMFFKSNEQGLSDTDCKDIENHVKRKVVDVLGGKDSESYRDKSVRSQIFSDIYTQIKREYGLVSSYKSIKRRYIADVHDFIDCYEPPRVLEELTENTNAQMRIA